jgi:predicted alpha-1,2-mannosidase
MMQVRFWLPMKQHETRQMNNVRQQIGTPYARCRLVARVGKGLLAFAVMMSAQFVSAQSLLSYVQPLSGTAPSTTVAAQKHSEAGSEKNANTIPAVGLPFAMTQWTPETRLTEVKCQPPYFYRDSLLTGFRGTHWLSGSCTQDYGSVTIMPVVGSLKTIAVKYAIPFSHQNETTTPAYYRLDLPSQQLTVEMTATLRCGFLQFTVNRDDSLYLLVRPNSDRQKAAVQVDPKAGTVVGWNPAYRIYQGWGTEAGFNGNFFVRVEKAIGTSGVFNSDQIVAGDSLTYGKEMGAFFGFAVKKGEKIRVQIGTSFSSVEGARLALQTELPNWNFAAAVETAKAQWEKALGQIRIETNNKRNKRIFYTALYHALQHPRLFSDVDGTYPRFAGSYTLQKTSGAYYDDFSMWDIYRAQLPLLEILQPLRILQFVQSMIVKGQQGGWLPIFPCWNNYTAAMIGDHGTAFIASAFAKGIRQYDVAEAYRLMRQNAFATPPAEAYRNGLGRRALSSYLQYGYIPLEDSVPEAFHKKEQVSRTLEYAYDDYALSVVAKALVERKDYEQLQQRAFNYRNVFDPSVGMVRGRKSSGEWVAPFLPDRREPYITEGTPRQYSFYVPQDVKGLALLMGGEKALEAALDHLFAGNEYWHGNEPGHQIPFLYNYTATPWKTQRIVQKILAEEYDDGPGGLSGNDDAGQMSAWYVFASMGFYPVDPVSGEYLLSTPLFDAVTLQLESGKTFRVRCHKRRGDAVFIDKLSLNGKPYEKSFLRHQDIVTGGVLDVYLSATPTNWAAKKSSRPSSLTK